MEQPVFLGCCEASYMEGGVTLLSQGSAGWGWMPLLFRKGFKECWGAEPPNYILILPGHFHVTDQKPKLFLCHSENKRSVWEPGAE